MKALEVACPSKPAVSKETMIEKSVLLEMFQATCGSCPSCKTKMELTIETRSADAWLQVKCKVCQHEVYSTAPKTVNNGKFSQNNVTLVTCALLSGAGYEGNRRVAAMLNTKHLTSTAFYEIQRFVGERIMSLQKKYRATINEEVFKAYAERGIMPDANGILDVCGSYDGSWMTRGHTSHIGLGCFIDIETGYVLDCEILSNFCMRCSHLDSKLKNKSITKNEYDERKAAHNPKCQKNFDGKAGAMEAEGAVRIWERSVATNKMRYVKFVGDGDSSAFRAVTALQPYGDTNVEKEECVNHISKRLGSRLRKLREETREETASGRKRTVIGGKNKLTDKVIDKLTFYYGQAIRRNISGTVEEMQKDIMASYYHCSSTDSEPRHEQCPPGKVLVFFPKSQS